MPEENRLSRLWGWDTWLNDRVLPLAAPSSGREGAQLWIFCGSLESGRNELLTTMRTVFSEAAQFGDGGVEWIARQAEENAFEFQARAAEVLAGQSVPAMSAGGPLSAEDSRFPDLALGSDEPDVALPSYFLVRDGDAMSPAWWRLQMREWMARFPTACLMVTAGQKAEPIIEAFRQAGGSMRGVFQRELTPWDDATIAAWKEAFLPQDRRSVDELRKRSRGGWPGALWDLFETERREAESATRRNHLRLVVTGLSPGDRECLFVAANAPAPARDFVEVLLQREVEMATWRRLERLWKKHGLLDESGGWASNSYPAQISEVCRELGDDPVRLDATMLKHLKRLCSFLPGERERRLVAPVGAFEHLDREVLVALFDGRGNEMWECLRSLPGVCPRGAGPQTLDRGFYVPLRDYAESLPGGVERNLDKRIREQWVERKKALHSEVDQLVERESALRGRVEKARVEMQHHEKQLADLRKRRRPRSRRVRIQPDAGRARKVDRSRQILGALGIVLGIGWIYLSFIQNNSFHLYPTLGGFALVFVGFAAAFSAVDSTPAPAKRSAPKAGPNAAEQALEKAISSEQHQFTIARNFHDQLFKEAAHGKTLASQLEESLRRPYLRG